MDFPFLPWPHLQFRRRVVHQSDPKIKNKLITIEQVVILTFWCIIIVQGFPKKRRPFPKNQNYSLELSDDQEVKIIWNINLQYLSIGRFFFYKKPCNVQTIISQFLMTGIKMLWQLWQTLKFSSLPEFSAELLREICGKKEILLIRCWSQSNRLVRNLQRHFMQPKPKKYYS